MTISSDRRRFPWGLTVLVGLCLIVLLALGTWQVQRLQWKQDLIAAAEAAQARPPAPAAQVLAGPDPEFRRVFADCPGLPTAPFVELQSIHEGRPGVRLISACPLPAPAGGSLLVDRGFVADGVSARPPESPGPEGAETSPVRVTGVLRDPGVANPFAAGAAEGRRFLARDVAAMAAALDAPDPAPLFLMAETSTNPEWAALTPAVPPPAFSNNHLGYAITWYGLAAALLGVYVAFLRRRLK